MYALVKLSEAAHIAVTSGIPRLVVLAAPQKQTAMVCSLDMRWTRITRRKTFGTWLRANCESARTGFTLAARIAGGRAM